ncbi:MAG: hypothetical protein QOI63_1123 [Thermoplasmata archaeon]|jgi:hypothetical protein|nr:hypothetical protein [Thermoplasmata archaeon]
MSAASQAPCLQVEAADAEGLSARDLLASLNDRLRVLPATTAHAAVGSLAAGLTLLGQQARGSGQGAELHRAIAASRVGANGEALWRHFGIARWVECMEPCSPFRQGAWDCMLLLEDPAELAKLLAQPLPAYRPRLTTGLPPVADATFADYLVGTYLHAVHTAQVIEAALGVRR